MKHRSYFILLLLSVFILNGIIEAFSSPVNPVHQKQDSRPGNKTLNTGTSLKPLVIIDRLRVEKQLDAFVSKRLNHFSTDGRLNNDVSLKPYRPLELLAFSHALLASGNAKAVEEANYYLSNTNSMEWYRACYIFLKYQKLLTEKSKKNMRGIIDKNAPGYLKEFWDFVGINDNFPSMATAGCAMYGEISGNKEYIDKAYNRLLAFKSQLIRSGLNSEYCSQAYCYLQVEGMAMLVELTSNQELKKLGMQVEERLWFDILGHFYLPAFKMAAPYSRAYAWDMRGEGLTYCMIEQVLGNVLPFHYLDDYFEPSEEWIKCRNAACYGVEYHCPQYLVDELVNRKYPYSFIAIADGGPGSEDAEFVAHGINSQARSTDQDDGITEYGAWQTRVETYMTSKYALSTSLIPFHSGVQTENFLLVYPRKTNESFRNTATVFSRLVINDVMTLKTLGTGYGDFGIGFGEFGRRMAFQEKNTAMVLYKPKTYLNKGLTSMRSCIFIPNNEWMKGKNTIDEIWIGNKKLDSFNAASQTVETVFVKDGNVYMAYIPLIAANMGVKDPVTIEGKDGYTIISFWNYKGVAIDLTVRAFQNKGNGFVCEVASTDEYPSFEAFRKAMSAAKVTDEYHTYPHYRSNMVRNTLYERKGLSMENNYSPGTESIRYTTINGKYRMTPRLQVTGNAVKRIPLNE
ncbi:MAG: hypothetical protein PHS30_02995 [Bacteroidales bacterium]|nr:hypothetical protein [Bacteroidales bacterium]